tara:strand:- start:28993 stop:31593 length:2601 start_codon:yes stop_codon:yes gene_type:complete
VARSNDPLDTPVMRQYLDMKSRYPDCILFFRMGDFYEMFLDDAKTAAPIMDIALTRRQGDVPMAGVPYHSVDTYLARLVNSGLRVAIAEQKQDPENPKLMQRRVARILSPGTLLEEGLLTGSQANYLMALSFDEEKCGLALADISTGDFFCYETLARGTLDGMGPRDFIARYQPGEILLASDQRNQLDSMPDQIRSRIRPLESYKSSVSEGIRQIEHRYHARVEGLGFQRDSIAAGAVSLILHYVSEAFPDRPPHLKAPVLRAPAAHSLVLDEKTIRNLELVENRNSSATLLGVIDATRTAPGKRALRKRLLSPFRTAGDIRKSHDALAVLRNKPEDLSYFCENLDRISDLERILSRMESGKVAPRDFRNIIQSAEAAGQIQSRLESPELKNVQSNAAVQVPGELVDLCHWLDTNLQEELPALFGNGPLLKDGVDSELDEARKARTDGARWILELETAEKERTGLNLKIKYNRVSGYFIEISKSQADQAPADYERKQTLVNAERFTFAPLKDLERKILSADEIIASVEQRYLEDLTARILEQSASIRELMLQVSQLDVCQSLASIARNRQWCRPEIVEDGSLEIRGGRHPVVEKFLPSGEQFIPNDTYLDQDAQSFALITGPNMAGKSTYIRQVALIQILFQMGAYVPATEARLSCADRIFTRIGAGDDLSRGESTFFVEMLETASILNQHTASSLIIMDEIGRGTSTYDGLAIARSVAEFLTAKDSRPRCLFATHYHELTDLSDRPGIVNLTVQVEEHDGKVVFLRKVIPGNADRSYGIHVARLAGLPSSVLSRAEYILAELENHSLQVRKNTRAEKLHSEIEAPENLSSEQSPDKPNSKKSKRGPVKSEPGAQADSDTNQMGLF